MDLMGERVMVGNENPSTVSIQWFPGHMTKAKRQMETMLKSVDMVIECRDARAPKACENPLLDRLIQSKPHLVVLTKADLADPSCTDRLKQQYQNDTTKVLAIDSLHSFKINTIVTACMALMKPKHDRQKARGINPRAIRAMVCGIPNVGKSTLINHMRKKKTLTVENRPGVTRSLTWIHVDPRLDLCDTPGLLWPRFDDNDVAITLALINAIKQDVVDQQDLAMAAMERLLKWYRPLLDQRYHGFDGAHPFESIAKATNSDITGAYRILLNDLNAARLGRISYEGHV